MAKPITIPNTFASATSAIPLSQLDQDFSTLANATNDLATYSNYVADTGAADAFIANYPANTNTSSLTTGLRLQFKAANANTGASTLNVQVNGASIGTASIRLTDGSALPANTIIAGALVDVMYDGTNFQIMNDPSGGQEIISNLTLSGNLTVAGTSTFTGNVTGNVVNTTTSTITNLTSSNVTITGGSIDNISITNLTSLTVDGNTTLGDASGDTLTITGTTVTTPNGLNFDSNTLVIDAANNRIGVNNATPTTALDVTGTATISTNLAFTGTGNRITGDFSNATLANRVAFQTSTVNGNTGIGIIPNGTSTTSSIRPYNNSDPTNAGTLDLAALVTDMRISSAITGTGTYVPLTFYTGGSERLRIDTAGFVGIGTNSPQTKLQLDYTGSNAAAATGLGAFQINQSGVTALSGTGGIEFKCSIFGSGYGTKLVAFDDGSLVIGNRANSATWSERMRIDSSGNVGIGTSSPSAKLDVNGTLNTSGIVNINGSGGGNTLNIWGTNGVGIRIASTSTSTSSYITQEASSELRTNVSGFLTWYTGGSEKMRIDSSGNVGIGTTSGTYRLNLSGNANALRVDATNTATDVLASFAGRGVIGVDAPGTPNGRFIITDAGNVGIGTSSPSQVLEVSKSQDTETQVRVVNANTGSSARSGFVLGNNSNAGAASLLLNSSNNTGLGGANALNMYQGLSAPIAFFTDATERMRITSGGDLLLGTTSDTDQRMRITYNGTTPAWGIKMHNTATSGDNKFIEFGTEASFTTRGSISYNRGGGVVAYNTTSDYRLKENIVDLPNALQTISQLKPRQFDWKETGNTTTGFIAHELAEVLPHAVTGEKDAVNEDGSPQYQGIDTSFLVATLTAAIQELKAELDATKAEVALLKSK